MPDIKLRPTSKITSAGLSADGDKPAHDAFRVKSRSPNVVPFDTLGMVSY